MENGRPAKTQKMTKRSLDAALRVQRAECRVPEAECNLAFRTKVLKYTSRDGVSFSKYK